MSRLSRLILFAAVAGCSFGTAAEVALDTEFILKIAETADVSPAGIEVTFKEVSEDSRCPSKVTCVWEGQAKVTLHIDYGGGNRHEPTFVIRGGTPQKPLQAKLKDYTLNLISLDPYPEEAVPIPAVSYSVKLMVTKDSDEPDGEGE